MRAAALVVAAGEGRRFGGAKQRAVLLGRPLYLHALGDLLRHPRVDTLVLAVPAGDEDRYRGEVRGLPGGARVHVTSGGTTRTASVARALGALDGADPARRCDAVLVHDAARPAAPPDLVDRLLDALYADEGAVPALPVQDTLRWRAEAGGPDRDRVVRVGTPQAFRRNALEAAHRRAAAAGAEATDDATLVEAAGGRIALIDADARIEKVTWPADLAAAGARLSPDWPWPPLPRTGLGLDHHRLAPGRPLWLCGVRVADDEGLVGHSDGDVALHAVANAVLAAAGERDIGTHLPPDDPTTAGMSSTRVLALALERAGARSLRPVQAQVVLTAPRPRLAPHVPAMVARLAILLGLAEGAVAVHATSGEGLIRDAIEAHALVSLIGAANAS